jgi:hypothetical protein
VKFGAAFHAGYSCGFGGMIGASHDITPFDFTWRR